jgi:predicted nucleotide-binding protein
MGVRFRQVNGEFGRERFRVFLIHGRSRDWSKVKKFIEHEIRFEVVVSIEKFTGQPLIQKVREAVWHHCDCAVAILSADDLQRNRTRTARPNVILEVGYSMGFFDHRYWSENALEPVILVTEDKTAIPSDLDGIEQIRFARRGQGIAAAFGRLGQALNDLHKRVDSYFA